MNSEKNIFYEEQKPRQWWIQVIIICYSLFLTYLTAQQVFFDIPFFNLGMSDWLLILLWLFFAIFIPVLYYRSKLIVKVKNNDEKGIYIKYYPFHFDFIKIDPDEIEEFEIIEYDPLKDYGGWGVRYGQKGNAFNAYGNKGVNLKLKYSRDLLIGSQTPEKLNEAIKNLIS